MPEYAYNPMVHDCFIQPTDPNVSVWRYMDMIKFLSLLQKEALFFCRADKFADQFEGSVTIATVEARRKSGVNNLKNAEQWTKEMRQQTVINCWHLNEHESAAMWNLYLEHNQGVAIRSTFARFCKSLPQRDTERTVVGTGIFVGLVKYIDYDRQEMPENNSFWPFVHKRKSFEHEREVRAVLTHFPEKDDQLLHDGTNSFPDGGAFIPVSLRTLIEAVFVPPTASKLTVELVENVVQKYGFEFPVKQSLLGKNPVF